MGLEQLGQERAREQRRVAGEDEHLVDAVERLPGRPRGVAGSERLLLHCDGDAVEAAGTLR